jgi:hypothetical protein
VRWNITPASYDDSEFDFCLYLLTFTLVCLSLSLHGSEALLSTLQKRLETLHSNIIATPLLMRAFSSHDKEGGESEGIYSSSDDAPEWIPGRHNPGEREEEEEEDDGIWPNDWPMSPLGPSH